MSFSITDCIDSILPQIQCMKCGYESCKSYANSIYKNMESINKCIPGGKKSFFFFINPNPPKICFV